MAAQQLDLFSPQQDDVEFMSEYTPLAINDFYRRDNVSVRFDNYLPTSPLRRSVLNREIRDHLCYYLPVPPGVYGVHERINRRVARQITVRGCYHFYGTQRSRTNYPDNPSLRLLANAGGMGFYRWLNLSSRVKEEVIRLVKLSGKWMIYA